ncbi:PBECR2 nuclease fold domain-containing protein [Tistrella bauzanensis]|uniref:PBECR2 nuclease fold domain-containing protein n=1 Tax=Tistrella TaxID=171436 RepID=UPI0031F6CB67
MTDQLMEATQPHIRRRLAAARRILEAVDGYEAAGRGLLELASRWTPDALAGLLRPAMDVAAYEGREAVFVDFDDEGLSLGEDGSAAFAEPEIRRAFTEQVAFLAQKRVSPTRSWRDALQGDHDRAFVVAGATDVSMLEEIHAAVIEAAETYDYSAFKSRLTEVIERYDWQHSGQRERRIRTIYETNIRSAYMAGRLRQMTDPDVLRLMPYWQYLHAETRVPADPRPQHLAWDGVTLLWDNTWWITHFPPNGWFCSCGIRALSERRAKKQPRWGEDAPADVMRKVWDPARGAEIEVPQGVDVGWDYQPGALWSKGLTPSALIDPADGMLEVTGRHVVEVDTPAPLDDLLAASKPFTADALGDDLDPEDYVRGFLAPFGADIGAPALWEDQTGEKLPISEEFFQTRTGEWKIGNRDRATMTPLLAETLLDPDEIWLGVAAKINPANPTHVDLVMDRRYVRTDGKRGLIVVMEVGRRWWQAVTAFPTVGKKGRPDLRALNKRRGGKLLWKRNDRSG